MWNKTIKNMISQKQRFFR